MALKQTIEHEGATLADAYIKIDHIFVTTQSIGIQYQVYASDAWRQAGGNFLFTARVEVPFSDVMPGTNPTQMGYEAMKMLDAFSGAVDC